MHYRDADEKYFSIVDEHAHDVYSKASSTQFPQTYRAMIMFCAKTNSLKTGMFECIDSDNPYSFNVLFRCFCEHYLKFMYIWTRFLSEEKDTVGTEYYSFCGASEARDYVSAIAMTEGLLGNSVAANVEANIALIYPETATLTAKEVEQASNRFKYRSILRFLAGEKMKFVAKERPFLAQIVPAYALLSSFVHGGPYTDMEMINYSEPEALQDCEQKAEIVFLMTASVFMMTTMAMSREYPAAIQISTKVKEIMNRFLSDIESKI